MRRYLYSAIFGLGAGAALIAALRWFAPEVTVSHFGNLIGLAAAGGGIVGWRLGKRASSREQQRDD